MDKEGQYGQSVARAEEAYNCADDAHKLAKEFNRYFDYDYHETIGAETGNLLEEMSNKLYNLTKENFESYEKDNDFIYHDIVPKLTTLAPIEKLEVAKPISFKSLFKPEVISKMIGEDCFQKLVPISVHETSSLYSEEMAKLTRHQTDLIDAANAELDSSLTYMKLPACLEQFKINHDETNKTNQVPESVFDFMEEIRHLENNNSLLSTLKQLNNLNDECTAICKDVNLVLNKDMKEFEELRVNIYI